MRDNQPLGIVAELQAIRNSILSTARMSPAAKARALGRPFCQSPVSKTHRIVVDMKAGTKTVETRYPEPKTVKLVPAPHRTTKRRYFQSAHSGIFNAVAEAWGITVFALLSQSQARKAAWPRFAVFRLLRRKGLSLTQIGAIMKRDHSTVLSGLRRAEYMLELDPTWAARYRAAEQALARK